MSVTRRPKLPFLQIHSSAPHSLRPSPSPAPSLAISEKLKALLAIAEKVQKGGKQVSAEDVVRARSQGATDKEIHDTVLIAAAFCMYNRYVDGLATWAPADPEMYRKNGKQLANHGYVLSTENLPGA